MNGFPTQFCWGVAAAAYQIEGATHDGGRGQSVWDVFCARSGVIWSGHSGDQACDHYHRYPEDIALMKALGVHAYRLSVAWPRVQPTGIGPAEPRGLEFYDRLVDGLLEAGIEPWLTLYHWDMPWELFCRGGWLNRDCADWFAEYAAIVVERLSDRVKKFMTLNEPQVFIGEGHSNGNHAPGLQLPWREVLRVGHHALLAHGRAVQSMRAAARRPIEIGYAPVLLPKVPASDSAEDLEAAREATFAVTERSHWTNSWWLDPVVLGHYPADGLELYAADLPPMLAEDAATIAQPLDFLGINIYTAERVRRAADGGIETVVRSPGQPISAFNWPIVPECVHYGPRFLAERYGLPIAITENGISCRDTVGLDGRVVDGARIDYLQRHLLELERACAAGVDLRAYFHWSILDNFEWAEGYKERFGLVFVDYETQARIPKESFRYYQQVIASNGACLATR